MAKYLRQCFASSKPAKVTPLQDCSSGLDLTEPNQATTVGASKIDFAYSINQGYDGLILHAISPSWAARLYPWLATDPVEKFASLSLLVCSAIASMPCMTGKVPMSWTHASWGVYLSAFHRALLVDLRLLRLLLRQFDVWYIIANMMLVIWSVVGGTFTAETIVYGVNMALACSTTLIFDCIRVPMPVTIQTCVGYAFICYFWSVYHFLELGNERVVDYRSILFGTVRGISVFIGRMGTLGTFFVRYSSNLLRHPEAYVALHLPILLKNRQALLRHAPRSLLNLSARSVMPSSEPSPRACQGGKALDGSSAHLSGTAAEADGGTTGPATHVDEISRSGAHYLATRDGSSSIPIQDLLLYHVLPCCPSSCRRYYLMLTSQACEVLLLCAWGAGAMLPLVWLFGLAGVSMEVAQASSMLLHVPSLQRLLLLDVRLLPLLAWHFDTLWLSAQVVMALVSLAHKDPLRGNVLTHPAAKTYLTHVVLSTATAALLPDALHMSARHKLQALVLIGGLLLVLTLLFTIRTCPYLDKEALLMYGVPIGSFLAGRLLTLGTYCVRFAGKVWLRPDTFVVLYEPMYRKDEDQTMLNTLRDAASVEMPNPALGNDKVNTLT